MTFFKTFFFFFLVPIIIKTPATPAKPERLYRALLKSKSDCYDIIAVQAATLRVHTTNQNDGDFKAIPQRPEFKQFIFPLPIVCNYTLNES